jgi:hypothetical protein
MQNGRQMGGVVELAAWYMKTSLCCHVVSTSRSDFISSFKMKSLITASLAALSLASGALSGPVAPRSDILFFKPLSVESDSVHNVHIGFNDDAFEGEVRVVFGECDMSGSHARHHELGSSWIKRTARPERLVWIVPGDATHGGCLHAYSGSGLIGRSAPISVKHQPRKREDISDVADTTGPWCE